MTTRRLIARKAVDAARGTARITEETMKRLNLADGEPVELSYGNNTHSIKAEKGVTGTSEIILNQDDLKALGATDGLRLAVRNAK